MRPWQQRAAVVLVLGAVGCTAPAARPYTIDEMDALGMPAAYRITSAHLRDPHIFIDALGCHDITDEGFLSPSVNELVASGLRSDANGDGRLDLTLAVILEPFAPGELRVPARAEILECFSDLSSCRTPAMPQRFTAMANNRATGECLGAMAGTMRPYGPLTTPTGPCFALEETELAFPLGGITLSLKHTQVAATYDEGRSRRLVNGLVRGFLPQADADSFLLPTNVPVVGGRPVSDLFAGDPDSCGTASGNDLDALADGTRGWWVYVEFEAERLETYRE